MNSKRRGELLFSPLIVLSLFAASGCAVHRVRADFTGFEKAYAETSNEELLLNLARLQNHDHTYFFKMGQITSSYRMSAAVPTSVGYASQSSAAGTSNTTGGATPGLSYESDPLFQFIPVNDETNAQLLLKQIQPETFYILYQQGWRINQLFRVMIDRIEVTQSTATSCSTKVYRNVPPAVDTNDTELGGIKQQELSSYAGFLRASAIAYALQRHGNLVLREISPFVPLDDQSVTAGPSTGGSGGNTQNATPPDAKKDEVSASDIEKAAEKNFSFEKVPLQAAQITSGQAATGQTTSGLATPVHPANSQPAPVQPANGRPTPVQPASSAETKTLIGQRVPTARFYLIRTPPDWNKANKTPEEQLGVDPTDEILQEIESDSSLGMTELAQKKGDPPLSAVDIFLLSVKNGFAIEDNETAGTKGAGCPTTPSTEFNARLVLRSLIGVMAAAAQEQTPFELIKQNHLKIEDLKEEPEPIAFNDAVPTIEQLPILRINWSENGKVEPGLMQPLTQVEYNVTDYRITDPAPPKSKDSTSAASKNSASAETKDTTPPENKYWNRDVFRLIAALTAQVTVDTSKYPIANILQLNSIE